MYKRVYISFTATCNPEELRSPANGDYMCSDDNDIGSVCTFYCNDKYDLVGTKNMVCMGTQSGAKWSSPPPSCIGMLSVVSSHYTAISAADIVTLL